MGQIDEDDINKNCLIETVLDEEGRELRGDEMHKHVL